MQRDQNESPPHTLARIYTRAWDINENNENRRENIVLIEMYYSYEKPIPAYGSLKMHPGIIHRREIIIFNFVDDRSLSTLGQVRLSSLMQFGDSTR
jgi:hypothetical protein